MSDSWVTDTFLVLEKKRKQKKSPPSYSELARQCTGVSRARLERLLTGETKTASLSDFAKIAQALDQDPLFCIRQAGVESNLDAYLGAIGLHQTPFVPKQERNYVLQALAYKNKPSYLRLHGITDHLLSAVAQNGNNNQLPWPNKTKRLVLLGTYQDQLQSPWALCVLEPWGYPAACIFDDRHRLIRLMRRMVGDSQREFGLAGLSPGIFFVLKQNSLPGGDLETITKTATAHPLTTQSFKRNLGNELSDSLYDSCIFTPDKL